MGTEDRGFPYLLPSVRKQQARMMTQTGRGRWKGGEKRILGRERVGEKMMAYSSIAVLMCLALSARCVLTLLILVAL